jgi:predicted choloylglycine hydrolase
MIRKRPLATLIGATLILLAGVACSFFLLPLGVLLLLISILIYAAWFFEYKRLIFPRFVDKQKHIYTGLRYQGDVPILILKTADPKEKGRLLGQHTAAQFIELWDRYIQFIPYAMQYITGRFTPHPLVIIKEEIERLQLYFPGYLIAEMEGYLEEVHKIRKMFSLEDFKIFYAFADIYKGLGGCGAAVRPFELMRNLDWYSMGVLGDTTLLTVTPVRQLRSGGPKKTVSITFPPCLLGLSMANDSGFAVTLNEATKMHSKRNHPGGYPEFLLLREIAEHSTTVAEAIAFIDKHPPASSHILAMMDKGGDGAIVQMLPTGSSELYTVRRLKDAYIHATNHFIDPSGRMVPGSEAINSSLPRYQSMEKALEEQKRGREVLAAGNCFVTMQTMIFSHLNDQFILDFNYDNYAAGKKGNPLSRINLTTLFSE